MSHIKKFNSWLINENFSSLEDQIKMKIHEILNEIEDQSIEKVDTNSEVANPRSLARNPFYKRGSRNLQGYGESYRGIVSGSVEDTGSDIEFKVEHGAKYSNGKKTFYITHVKLNKDSLEYEKNLISKDL